MKKIIYVKDLFSMEYGEMDYIQELSDEEVLCKGSGTGRHYIVNKINILPDSFAAQVELVEGLKKELIVITNKYNEAKGILNETL